MDAVLCAAGGRMKIRKKRQSWQSLITGKTKPEMRPESGHKQYSPWFCLLMNIMDPRVPCRYGHGCKWVAPFGYVSNMSCPKHGEQA